MEITHATYGVGDEPLEAVVSVRPATGNVIVFETYEGAPGEDQDDEPAGQLGPGRLPASERDPPMPAESVFDDTASRGSLTPDEADAWTQELHQLGREGRYFFSLNRYLFLASR